MTNRALISQCFPALSITRSLSFRIRKLVCCKEQSLRIDTFIIRKKPSTPLSSMISTYYQYFHTTNTVKRPHTSQWFFATSRDLFPWHFLPVCIYVDLFCLNFEAKFFTKFYFIWICWIKSHLFKFEYSLDFLAM